MNRLLEGRWQKCPPECHQNCPRTIACNYRATARKIDVMITKTPTRRERKMRDFESKSHISPHFMTIFTMAFSHV